VVREGDKIQHVTKLCGMVKTLVNRGLKGDTKAATAVLSRVEPADESKVFSVEEGHEFARRVFDLAIRFVPEEKREEVLTEIEKLLGIEPKSGQLTTSSSSPSLLTP